MRPLLIRRSSRTSQTKGYLGIRLRISCRAISEQSRQLIASVDVYSSDVLWELVYTSPLTVDDMADEARVTAFSEALSERLLTLSGNNVRFECFVRRDPERGTYYVVVRRTAHSVASDIVLGHNLFSSGEYKQLTELGALLAASVTSESL